MTYPLSRRGFLSAGSSALAAALLLDPTAVAQARSARRVLEFGALLSLTGDWSTLGLASQAALEIAVEEINETFRATGRRTRVRVNVRDTRLEPELALKELKRLGARGVPAVIGPQSSAEVRALQEYAQQKGILMLSMGSTASSLAAPGDNVLRFCPSDIHEGEAVAALMFAEGIRSIVPMWRDDPGNDGLRNSAVAEFQKLGGQFSGGVEYGAETTDFQLAVEALSGQVSQAQAAGPGPVAVYYASFDETVHVFTLAQSDPVLANVRWYGADGVALSQALLRSPEAAAFAQKVGFPVPTFGLDPSAAPRYEPLSTEIERRIGFEPDAFALASYDALWVAALTLEGISPNAKPSLRRQAVIETADRFWGATGWTLLDEAGDRAIGNYTFYAIGELEGERRWFPVANYANGRLEVG